MNAAEKRELFGLLDQNAPLRFCKNCAFYKVTRIGESICTHESAGRMDLVLGEVLGNSCSEQRYCSSAEAAFRCGRTGQHFIPKKETDEAK